MLRFTLFLGVLFSALLVLLRAQVYDDQSARDLLPQTCDTSCFMDIHLGTTSDEEALSLLKAHPWVDPNSVRLIPLPPSPSKFDDLEHIQWEWNSSHPAFLLPNPQRADANINIRNHKVESIAFDTLIPAGAIYNLRGDPSVMDFGTARHFEPWSVEWVYTYTNTQLNLQMQVRACPYLSDLWLQPLHIQMSLRAPIQDSTTSLTTPSIDLRATLKARERIMC